MHAPADGCKYTIKAGDSFWSIANARGVPLEAITSLNLGVVPTALQIGQMINVPCPSTSESATLGAALSWTLVPLSRARGGFGVRACVAHGAGGHFCSPVHCVRMQVVARRR